ncbi:LexA family transcriptional regulator [Tatumella sp. UCD-D_suzukii]|uniref:LexA family protein n=1 Tax=Tatumella sp. UCD-D_suzukii TaxID=1408192 RepID=UPI000471A64E|nr:S24 family peptidase [Tatumella sp. UCD-D_suzukii]
MNMKWYEVAKIRMKELDINQEKLAEYLDITKGAVSHWLNARREPSLEDIAKIMKYLGFREFIVNHDGTISTAGGNENVSNLTPYKPGKEYPVLSSVQAGCWAEAIEAYTLNEISEWLESDAHIQGDAFWLLVDGDSMTAPAGQSVPEGNYVLFDTGKEAINGSLVIAKLVDSNEATFKKLIIDGGQKYLKGLNPAWPMVPINGNCKIIGVAVEAKMRFK